MDYLFVVGFISILSQVVLLRELSVSLYGVELIYTLAMGIWLLCTACGAMISRKSADPSFAKINILLLLLSIAIPLDVIFIRSAHLFVSTIPGSFVPLHVQIGILCGSLLPIGLALGLLFQWTARIYVSKRKTLAGAYAVESLGGLAGGICATFFLKFGFQNFLIALLCAMAAAGACYLCIDRKSASWIYPAAAVTIIALTMAVWRSHPIDRIMTAWTHPNLVDVIDTPYSRVTVASRHGQTSVFENNALVFDTESTRAEEFVNLAALQHPDPKRVLVLGGGIEGTIREVLLHSPQRVDYVELNSALIEVVPQHLPPEIRRSLKAPGLRIIHDDPRRFLDRSLSYDLILIGMPEPASSQANRFYTRDFFRQCHSRLTEGGMIAFSLQSAENFWTPPLTRKMISIYRAAKSVFADVVFFPGGNCVVLASTQLLTRDAAIPARRMEERGIQPRIVSAAYLRYLYSNDRFQRIAQTLESGIAPMNTDVRPISHQYAIMVWLSKFNRSSRLWDVSLPELSGSRYAILLLVLAVPMMLLRLAPWSTRRTILAGIAGFAGMVLETILILHYQTRNGVLYQDVGILLTGFMAGLAAGAHVTEHLKRLLSRAAGMIILLGFAILNFFAGWRINSGKTASLSEVCGLLFLAGFFVAVLFAFAGLVKTIDQKQIIAPLYSADLIGGCAGSLLATLILAPMAGLALTAWLVVPAALLSALLL